MRGEKEKKKKKPFQLKALLVGFAGNQHAGRRAAAVSPPLQHRLSPALIKLITSQNQPHPGHMGCACVMMPLSLKRVNPIAPVLSQSSLLSQARLPLQEHLCHPLHACLCPTAPAALRQQMPPLCKVLHFQISSLRARQVQLLVPRHNCTMVWGHWAPSAGC